MSRRGDQQRLMELCHRIVTHRDDPQLPGLIEDLAQVLYRLGEAHPSPGKGVPDQAKWRSLAEAQAEEAVERGDVEFSVNVRYLMRRERELTRNYIHRLIRKKELNSTIRWNKADGRLYVVIRDGEKESDGT